MQCTSHSQADNLTDALDKEKYLCAFDAAKQDTYK